MTSLGKILRSFENRVPDQQVMLIVITIIIL